MSTEVAPVLLLDVLVVAHVHAGCCIMVDDRNGIWRNARVPPGRDCSVVGVAGLAYRQIACKSANSLSSGLEAEGLRA